MTRAQGQPACLNNPVSIPALTAGCAAICTLFPSIYIRRASGVDSQICLKESNKSVHSHSCLKSAARFPKTASHDRAMLAWPDRTACVRHPFSRFHQSMCRTARQVGAGPLPSIANSDVSCRPAKPPGASCLVAEEDHGGLLCIDALVCESIMMSASAPLLVAPQRAELSGVAAEPHTADTLHSPLSQPCPSGQALLPMGNVRHGLPLPRRTRARHRRSAAPSAHQTLSQEALAGADGSPRRHSCTLADASWLLWQVS